MSDGNTLADYYYLRLLVKGVIKIGGGGKGQATVGSRSQHLELGFHGWSVQLQVCCKFHARYPGGALVL